ncbi:MAG TPA: hydantoinase/oxoprolinase family protein, partial [Candidatus Baltobacteraceae bacterium]|nr:hydantoinase/oxoprolinase family protein [Candidatus Baltobacteraceae bacterium]
TGEVVTLKVRTTTHEPQQGAIAALQRLLDRFEAPPEIEFLGHSTTIATNALLGQIGLELPRVAMITTHGFRDVIDIGRQNRSELYNLLVQRPVPLVAREDRFAVVERIDYRGNVLVALDDAAVAHLCEELRARAYDSIAICLLNSYANDAHERRIGEAIAAALPEVPVTQSAEIDREHREYERFSTAVVNAALAPVVQRYLEQLVREVRALGIASPLYVMRSDGGLARADRVAAHPAATIESGPAAGVVAAVELGRQIDAPHLLAFDMGGTTAKAGAIAGGLAQVSGEFEAAGKTHSGRAIKGSGYPVRFPFVDLAEVSAGGGTIAWIDDAGSLRVGPLSAGADPGPACYGASDRATVTDANVVLGRLNPTHLLGGTFPIDATRSRAAIERLARALGLSLEAAAAGIVTLIDAEMAKALRIVTIERGLDPRDFTLVAYGGGGPLHVCALAEELGIGCVLVPQHPGIFSAQGLLVADLAAHVVEPVMCDVAALDVAALEQRFSAHEAQARSALLEQGAREETIVYAREYDARYRGQGFELTIRHAPSRDAIAQHFHEAHRARYGYAVDDEPIELVNARSTAHGKLDNPSVTLSSPRSGRVEGRLHPQATRALWIDGAFCDAPVYQRDTLPADARIDGPAIIEQYDTTTYVAPGWICVLRLRAPRALRMTKDSAAT